MTQPITSMDGKRGSCIVGEFLTFLFHQRVYQVVFFQGDAVFYKVDCQEVVTEDQHLGFVFKLPVYSHGILT